MNTEKEKTSSEEQKKAEKVLKDKVPVQQTGTYSDALSALTSYYSFFR